MKYVVIDQHIIDVINEHRSLFEMEMPEIGEEWRVVAIAAPPAWEGETRVSMQHKDGRWMQLNGKDVTIQERYPTWKRYKGNEDKTCLLRQEDGDLYILHDGFEVKLQDLIDLLDKSL